MTLPTLTTHRLTLRPATGADASYLQSLWDQPEVRRFLFDDQPVSAELAESVLTDCLSRVEIGLGLWIIELRQTTRTLGCVGLGPTAIAQQYETQLANLVEPLAAIDPWNQGRGYATEAMRAMVAYAFDDLGLSEIAAVNDVPNVASARMLQRLGFVPLSQVPGPRNALQTYKLASAQNHE